jgi:hypothetical protein
VTGPRPLYSAWQAVARALAHVNCGVYWLGTGDIDTPPDGRSDCAGFAISFCYGLRRHRSGFNRGPWASVSNDLNVNGAIEDADHARELFVRAPGPPRIGDLLCYPTFRLPGRPQPWIGHVAIVVGVTAWDAARPAWAALQVVQCRGPDGETPGIVASSGAHWDEHDRDWPKPEHQSVLLRVVP